MKRTIRPDRLRDVQAARADAAARAAAQPKKRRARKRRQAAPKAATMPPPAPAPPIETRGLNQLRQLGDQLRLEPKVAQRRGELADLAALMRSAPKGR